MSIAQMNEHMIDHQMVGARPHLGMSLMVRADDVDVKRANQQLKQEIAEGVNGVAMIFAGAHNAFGFGLPANPDTIERLFDDIDLNGLHLRLDNHPHGAGLSNQFVEFLQKIRLTCKIHPSPLVLIQPQHWQVVGN